MNTLKNAARLLTLSLCVLALGVSVLQAQGTTVAVNIIAPNWEVASLSDLVDVTTLTLKPNVANFSISMTTNTQVRVFLEIELLWKLVGDAAPAQLFVTTTTAFTLVDSRTITSSDLERGSTSGLNPRTVFNTAQENRLKEQFRTMAYAPAGDYIIRVRVKDPVSFAIVGSGEHRTGVRSTSENLPVTILDPMDGSTVQSLNPTVSWTTDAQRVKVTFVEMRSRSPIEALTDPRQQSAIVEGSTYTYPVNAAFRLEPGKAYYVIVAPLVITPRGVVEAPPAISSFRVMENQLLTALESFFVSVGGDAAGSFETLKRMGFNPSGLTLNGRTITIQDLRALLNELTQIGVQGPSNPTGFRYVFQ